MSKQLSSSGNLKWGILLSYLSMGISILVSLFYTPIVIKNLGQQQYGIYNIAASVTGYLSLLNFGLGSTIIRYVTKLRAEKREREVESIYGLFITIYSVLAFLVLVVGGIVILFEDKIFNISTGAEGYRQLRLITFMMIINLAVSFPASVYHSIITSYERFAFLKITSIIISLLTPTIMIPLLLYGYKAVMLTAVVQSIHIAGSIAYVLYVHSRLKVKISFNFKGLDKSMLNSIFTYTSFIFLGIIVDQLYWNTDKIILSVMIGEIPVAVYAVASQIHSYYQQFSGSISDVFFPKVTRMVAENQSKEEMSNLFIKVGRLQALIMILILFGFIAFGQEFIFFWAGSGYEQSYWIALLVIGPATIPLIESTGFLIIKAMNKHRFRSILYLIIAIANVILSIPACVYMGAIGCAVCTCICVIIGHGFIMNWYYWKKIKIDIPNFWHQISKMFGVGAILCILTVIINNHINTSSFLLFIIKIVIFVILYTVVQYLLVMNNYEKKIFNDVCCKLYRKKSQQH